MNLFAKVFSNGGCGSSHGGHGFLKLLRRAVPFFTPIINVVGFMDIDSRCIRLLSCGFIVRHGNLPVLICRNKKLL
jgi:hypothetical protein